MNRILVHSLAAVILTFAAAFSGVAKGHAVEGEIVDSRCYKAMNKTGAEHQMCAKSCLKGGLPAGLLTSKSKYYTLLIQGHALAAVAGEQARVEGKVDKNASTIIPMKIQVKKNGSWKDVELLPQMM